MVSMPRGHSKAGWRDPTASRHEAMRKRANAQERLERLQWLGEQGESEAFGERRGLKRPLKSSFRGPSTPPKSQSTVQMETPEKPPKAEAPSIEVKACGLSREPLKRCPRPYHGRPKSRPRNRRRLRIWTRFPFFQSFSTCFPSNTDKTWIELAR